MSQQTKPGDDDIADIWLFVDHFSWTFDEV